jgi:uncharacterized secreted repeat protein (TIGR03808 family)
MTRDFDIGRRRWLLGAAALATTAPVAAFAKAAPAKPTPLLLASDFGLVPGTDIDQSAILQKAIDAAAERGVPLFIAGGNYRVGNIQLGFRTTVIGQDGATTFFAIGAEPIFSATEVTDVTVRSIGFDGVGSGASDRHGGLLAFKKCSNLMLAAVSVSGSPGNGIYLDGCSGALSGCRIDKAGAAGIFAINSHELTIGQSQVTNCGNGGILVWQDQSGPDGTIVTGNHIARIAAEDGGTGENGNGINIFRADNVIVTDNVISDCAFSAVRANSTRDVAIRGNTCRNLHEVAIYSEFAFSGSVIANNVVDGAAAGISITNLDQGGKLAVCSGNVVRNIVLDSASSPGSQRYGIYAEAQTAITGNSVDGVAGVGIAAGYGEFLDNVLIADNVISASDTGIGVSVAKGAGKVRIAGNMISGAKVRGIVGMRWDEVASSDLVSDAAQFPNVSIDGNIVGLTG